MSSGVSSRPSRDALIAGRMALEDAVATLVARTLSRAGVTSVLLKGAGTRQRLYAADEVRLSSDVDFLVGPDDFAAAQEQLQRLGFRNNYDAVAPQWVAMHADSWRHPSWPVPIDLHRHLWGVGVAPQAAWEVVRQRSEPLTIGAQLVLVPSTPLQLVLLALHASHHDTSRGKPVADLRRGVQQATGSTWDEARRIAESLSCASAVVDGLLRLPEGAALTSELRWPAEPLLQREGAPDQETPPYTTFGFRRLATTPGMHAKAALLMREIAPSANFMRTRAAHHALAGRGSLGLLAAYGLRLVEIARGAPAGYRAARQERNARLPDGR